ncbi:hypothetical protein ADIARSV_3265 [Arcticibacter svalbardensis MN12-7]|uniref:Uncharacterized protein n=1 Tax=Arcticibacter svalbardensis MN12-7 TaxID=1150600 RepID=R9GNZ0_9SPHI|nr:hypothetical protein ADIARSV_3265 [Arcticibacter svalbardensis MN12-7]
MDITPSKNPVKVPLIDPTVGLILDFYCIHIGIFHYHLTTLTAASIQQAL